MTAAAASSMRTRDDGTLDVMGSIGGVRGLLEASLPAAGFLVAFVLTEDLTLAIILAVALSVVFTVIRLVQRGTLVQALSGLVGVVLCAVVAYRTGEARDFYVLGFVTNAAYLAAFIISIAVRWPFLGLLFGLLRGEGLSWRRDTVRRRRYAMATWLVSAVLLARLLVQMPLYFADDLAGLGIARLVMGLPLYALALWWGWMLTRPAAEGHEAPTGDGQHPPAGTGPAAGQDSS